ncbi:MAG TPA: transporter substrate-binding domain-containing protein [Chloroflexi bacterium]|nr:MAG: hypothetical protein B6243_07610 [Anaerolineaceae bacterium 4572_5.2]HEY85195.1 transporter substrate-binding domain-containing protein [Chloroflexota bacterium]
MTKRMQWTLALFFVALIIWLGWRAYQHRQAQSGLAEIKQRGALRVGLDASFPPFESLDENGQVVGLDADLARAIADDLGVELEFVNIGFDGLYDALLIKRVDMLLSGLPVDPYRSRDVAYSTNYFNAGQVLVTRRDDIQLVDDLMGQTVAVEWGSLADMEARRLQKTIPNLQINPQPDAQSALQFDIAIVDGVTALGNQQMRIVKYLSDEWYAAAVSVENSALLAEINKTLARMQESGEMERLQEKRIGE